MNCVYCCAIVGSSISARFIEGQTRRNGRSDANQSKAARKVYMDWEAAGWLWPIFVGVQVTPKETIDKVCAVYKFGTKKNLNKLGMLLERDEDLGKFAYVLHISKWTGDVYTHITHNIHTKYMHTYTRVCVFYCYIFILLTTFPLLDFFLVVGDTLGLCYSFNRSVDEKIKARPMALKSPRANGLRVAFWSVWIMSTHPGMYWICEKREEREDYIHLWKWWPLRMLMVMNTILPICIDKYTYIWTGWRMLRWKSSLFNQDGALCLWEKITRVWYPKRGRKSLFSQSLSHYISNIHFPLLYMFCLYRNCSNCICRAFASKRTRRCQSSYGAIYIPSRSVGQLDESQICNECYGCPAYCERWFLIVLLYISLLLLLITRYTVFLSEFGFLIECNINIDNPNIYVFI